jgi:hypothetical protein
MQSQMNNSRKWGAAQCLAIGMAASLRRRVRRGSSGGTVSTTNKLLTILIGSSGAAETKAVQDAPDAWAKDNKTKVTANGCQRPDSAAWTGILMFHRTFASWD